MRWEDYHLYEFAVEGVLYGVHMPEFLDEPPVTSARHTRLAAVAPSVGTALTDLYDFGDSWQHDLVVSAITPPAPHRGRCNQCPCRGGLYKPDTDTESRVTIVQEAPEEPVA